MGILEQHYVKAIELLATGMNTSDDDISFLLLYSPKECCVVTVDRDKGEKLMHAVYDAMMKDSNISLACTATFTENH